MKTKLLIIAVLVTSAILRLYRLDSVPPLTDKSFLSLRLFSAVTSTASVFLLFLILRNPYRKNKLSLISAWIMSVSPWILEQGRIISGVNLAVFVILAAVWLIGIIKNRLAKGFVLVISLIIFFLVYPQIWLLKNFQLIQIQSFIDNLFSVFSPDMWFFRNISFYHLGLRDWGIIYLSFFPLLISGFYETVRSKNKRLLLVLIGIGLITSASPFFPETSEFFLAAPVISTVIALGLYKLFFKYKSLKFSAKFLAVFYILVITYEISQLLHFYFVHYPLQVMAGISQIPVPF